ncbi:PLP-dependent transferase [Epithele typhae]|uniref:PLP-dependent transferase n=1 Tax=Epithele typhae TaxID=378194 RepID=UPI002007FD0A|nr:PLP-dependent transferase [Epithele typhae]KAH9946373.1 PLP-dependent transferase [Epithele typhae]
MQRSVQDPHFHEKVSAWFLGPRAENFDLLKELFEGALDMHANTRKEYHPEDGEFITSAIKASSEFELAVDKLRTHIRLVTEGLNGWSVPFFSGRYMGHMDMETSMPSILGWMITILFNPNNVAYEASPITTVIELEVGKQLSAMLGYKTENIEPGEPEPWGHIAADGTLANMESMWAARNLKFYPLSLHAAMTQGDKPLGFIADDFKIPGTDELFRDLDAWQLLNLSPSVILGLPDDLQNQYSITSDFLTAALSPYLVQTAGKEELREIYKITDEPLYLVPSTKHYSWPKAAALVGIGSKNCANVPVDTNARMNISSLRTLLQECLDTKRAVYSIVAVIGSTEEGAVDPLDEMVKLRDEFAAKGLSFIVHADAAWGGYFASMIRDEPPLAGHEPMEGTPREDPPREFVPSMTMRRSSITQFEALCGADSITIDPHKAGYVPYPAGGLCYKDGRMRYLLTWSAPYLAQNTEGESIGIYGIEGSKPGAPAVACYLHNTITGLHKNGHGALLGEATFTCRRFASHWSAMSDDETPFIVEPFNALKDPSEKQFIRERIFGKTNEEIVADKVAFQCLCTLGSDLNINAFACNFRIDGRVNDDVEEANYLNKRVFDRLSITRPHIDPKTVPLFLTATTFALEDYGECVVDFQRRLGLETESGQDLFLLRNVVMSPFQSAGDFVQKLADIFQGVLEEETKNVVARNTVSNQVHSFLMQGEDDPYLVYRPNFYHANGRQQLIVRTTFADDAGREQYKQARALYPDAYFQFNSVETTIEDILTKMEVEGTVEPQGVPTTGDAILVTLTITDVLKNRPLNSRYRDGAYPASYTPFYLYGTPEQIYVDHILVRAPNAQITALDPVALSVQPALTAEQLARGVIAHAARPEAAMQPFGTGNTVFVPGATFAVEVFEDPNGAAAHGPGLAQGGSKIAEGTLGLGAAVFYDGVALNELEDAAAPSGRALSSAATSRFARPQKQQWTDAVKNHLRVARVDGAPPPPRAGHKGRGKGRGD